MKAFSYFCSTDGSYITDDPRTKHYSYTQGNNKRLYMVIAVDFDGTIVRHRYPQIGEEIPFAITTLKMLQQEQHRLILWTVREGDLLEEAVAWCRERGLEFYAVNKDFPEEDASGSGYSRKLKADLFIDDRSFGGLPDWGVIYHRINEGKALRANWHLLAPTGQDDSEPERKGFFGRLFGRK